MIQIKSIFEQISEQVFKMNNIREAKQFITDFVSEKGINEVDKKSILNNVNQTKTMYQIQRYICNSLLKYEGLGVSKPSQD